MATAQHTPGPWILDAPGSRRIDSGFAVKARTPEGPGFPTPSATGFYVIAEPPPHGRDRQAEQEANARLIAAAPDMLATLREAETGIAEAVRILDLMGRGGDARNLAVYGNNIRAVMRKAEG